MIEIDLKTEDGPQTKRSSRNYASMVLAESSLTAVSHIVSTENKYRKAFKIFVLLFCLSGFFYQSSTLLYHIFQYPSIVDIRIENPEVIDMPGITFCNNNGINRKKFCATFPDRCYEANEDFCFEHGSYCERNQTTMIPHEEYFALTDSLTLKDLLDIGENAEDLLQQR
ncbi:hypothetical protein AVEN_145027-1 [Araneus ventricosus]|uniref:Uncharacterized protein n=1 Tax=Araneus ventricosus TaxID=182803 RepID=A0A4Y2L974_ARAVE|nr:hypothetical protein AVEN_145027-1 [Araneus ventricosus]